MYNTRCIYAAPHVLLLGFQEFGWGILRGIGGQLEDWALAEQTQVENCNH